MSTSSSASVRWIGSPHHRQGRAGYRPEAIVIHVMEGSLRGTDAWFKDPRSKVSAHYGIGKTGEVHQYVAETNAAYHAGRVYKPTWPNAKAGVNPNLYTLGIEHEGFAADIWTEAMIKASSVLIHDLCERWSIPLDRDHVIGHREIYSRKTCPGTGVDLDKLVELARDETPPHPADQYNFLSDINIVTTKTRLNIRELPTSLSRSIDILEPGRSIGVVGFVTNGQNVNGNTRWYKLTNGKYLWSGGTHYSK